MSRIVMDQSGGGVRWPLDSSGNPAPLLLANGRKTRSLGDGVIDTSTDLAAALRDIPSGSRAVLEARPMTASSAVYAGRLSMVRHLGPGAITGQGHIVGELGVAEINADVAGAYAVEGRIEQVAGSTTVSACFIAAAKSDSEGAGGTVAVHADFLSNNFANHSHISAKYTLLNNDPNKKLRTLGPVELPGGVVIPRDRAAVVAGRYYPVEGVNGLYANTALSRGVAWAVPFVCPERTTWTKIGFTLGTGVASAVARLGIYTDVAGKPGALVLDAGTITCGTGDVGVREITISQQLDAGFYWLVIQSTGSASDTSITWAGMNGFNIMGMSSNTANDSTQYFANAVALPATAPATTYGGGGFAPFLWLRA